MSRRVAVALVLFFVSTATPAPTVAVAAGGDRVLHFFAGQPDGSIPNYGHLVLDRAGNLYGTTYFGGSGSCTQSNFNVKGCGTVFELSPRAGGGWNDRVLYSFKGGKDGSQPFGTVTLDAAGNIFGTTSAGGNSGCIPTWVYNGCGTVFELSPHSGAGWTERTLHIFTGGRDGGNPDSDLVLDGSENLYGTAYCGGFVSCYAQGNGAGVFFELTRAGNAWNETVLYSFGRTRQNLAHPSGNLTPDGTGNIYGSTANGVYEMKAPSRSSHWSELTLYTLTNVFSQGYYPQGGLAFDGSGNLYGTMYSGGDPSCRYGSGCGVIFQLTPSPDGHWTESVLHTFTGRGDGAFPEAGLTLDSTGRLYGTTGNGGDLTCNSGSGCGTVFMLRPSGTGWTEVVLHAFKQGAHDGSVPVSGVVSDRAGNIYGTTRYGGPESSPGLGTVFEVPRP